MTAAPLHSVSPVAVPMQWGQLAGAAHAPATLLLPIAVGTAMACEAQAGAGHWGGLKSRPSTSPGDRHGR